MISVNLLSSEAVHARRRAHRVRCWAMTITTVAGLAAIPVGVGVMKTARAAALEREIVPLEVKFEDTRAAVADLVAQCEELSVQTARADALRAKRNWASLLLAVTEHTGAEVWLVSIETMARSDDDSRRIAGERAVMLDGPMGIRITGYALDHEWLYAFMSGLKGAGLFGQVKLTQAGKEPVLDGMAVRFMLECGW